MSSAEAFRAAMAELRQEQANAIATHRADSQRLADMAAKLDAALQGQITDVDIAALAGEIRQAAQDLHQGLASTHTDAVGAQTANAGTSVVQGGSTAGSDVVSASSPGTIVPQTDAPNSAVPDSLGGGAMPRAEVTGGATAEKAPGEPIPPAKEGEEPKPAEPDVPSVADTPDVEDAGRKGGKKG